MKYFTLSTHSFIPVYLFIICFSLALPTSMFAQFTKVASPIGVELDADQSGGHAWGDLNNDGYLDVIMHEGTAGANVYARLYINSGPPNYTFGDSTNALIKGFEDHLSWGRQMLIVDFNNDGYNDILRGSGSSKGFEVYYNNGPSANYDFGISGTQQPDVFINSMPDGEEHNLEGIGAIDWNQDGWLDLIVDNDGGGNDIFENDQAGGFTYIFPGTAIGQTGFAASHTGDGDYLTVADIDNDGYVDFYGRKTNITNYWRFDSSISQFVNQTTPNITSSESDKGGVMFCDFDNDGDLDLFWTSEGTNELWRNDGKDIHGNDVWTATGLPGGSIASQTDIDGCDCGDVDHDGDLDIILGASSDSSYLLENQLVDIGSLTFNTVNIATDDNTESLSLVDYDSDGDLDLYFVVNGDSNQVWVNNTNDNNYLLVNALFDNGNGTSRYAIGANVMLKNCTGTIVGMRQVNGAKGHGSQHQNKLHFGVDPQETYLVEVHYVYENGSRATVIRTVVPEDEPNQEISIKDTDANGSTTCTGRGLPVDLRSFDIEYQGCDIMIRWAAEQELGFSHYILERSTDGMTYGEIQHIPAQGGERSHYYQYFDREAAGMNYYRLKMVDLDGTISYSPIQSAETPCANQIGLLDVYPNPLTTHSDGILHVKLYSNQREMKITLSNLFGQAIRVMNLEVERGWNTVRLDLYDLPSGNYYLSSEIDGAKKTMKVIRYNED